MMGWQDAPLVDEKPKGWRNAPLTEDAEEEAPSRTAMQSLGRQLGLTASHVVGGLGDLADVFTGPIRLLQNKVVPEEYRAQPLGSFLPETLGLPKPETTSERLVEGASRALAGGGGMIRGATALSGRVTPAVERIVQSLASRPALQAQAAAGSGVAASGAREAGVGPYGQLAAALLGGIAAPTAIKTGRVLAEPIKDIWNTVGAGVFKSKASVDRLLTDAMDTRFGDQAEAIVPAVRNVTEYVAGAKPTVAEAIVQANAKRPDQFGGGLVRLQKDLTGALGVEDVIPSRMKQQQAALDFERASVNATTEPMRRAALDAAGDVPVASVLARIREIAGTPGLRASEVVTKALDDVAEKLTRLSVGGKINADDLYTVRKELGNTITKFSKETATFDRRLTSGLERDVQRAIDDAIEAAGGKDWKKYLAEYSSRMKGIEAHEARLKEGKRISAMVKPTAPTNIISSELPQPPTLLSRPMMLVNYGLRWFAKDANDPLVKELARLMNHPDEFAALLKRPRADPLRMRAEDLMRKASVATSLTGELQE